MDFKRKMIVLSSLICVFTITLILGAVYNRENRSRKQRETPVFSGIVGKDVVSVQFSGDGNAVQLDKISGSWQVLIDGAYYPANTEKITQFIDTVVGMKNRRAVTSSPDDYGNYGLDENGRSTVIFKNDQGNDIVSLYLGNTAGPGGDVYGQISGQTAVFVTDGSVSLYINQGTDSWSDLVLFPEVDKTESVYSLAMNGSVAFSENEQCDVDHTIMRAEKGNEWIIRTSDGTVHEADQIRAEDVVRSFITARAGSFVPAEGDYGFSQPSVTFYLTAADGKTITFFLAEHDGFFVRKEGSLYTYSVPAWTVRQWIKDLTELKAVND